MFSARICKPSTIKHVKLPNGRLTIKFEHLDSKVSPTIMLNKKHSHSSAAQVAWLEWFEPLLLREKEYIQLYRVGQKNCTLR